eukprot:TRINITY_DN76415_c0_g1_i1.p1 TRINITY_DN76415_c0_g1~~TRINITY_DN76415_c0_g1_i1.p1  ORF type:complete len:348 (-),score=33.24 TRINITY_DN76415_c0_g1_i1:451-1425(-)
MLSSHFIKLCSARMSTATSVAASGFSASRSLQGRSWPSNKSSEYHRHSTRNNMTTPEYLEALDTHWKAPEHFEPVTKADRAALRFVKFLRRWSDRYFKDRLIQRACMLETIAAVPGLVAGFHHHLASLRRLKHCQWIKTVMDEAENERMHLMTFMHIIRPNLFQRILITSGQAAFLAAYCLSYAISPRFCHRAVGYLEEEAVHTYSQMLQFVDNGKIKNVAAPPIAKRYWNMPPAATLRDVILVIRADEADHKLVNHYMSDAYGALRGQACEHFELKNLDDPEQNPHIEKTACTGHHHEESEAEEEREAVHAHVHARPKAQHHH